MLKKLFSRKNDKFSDEEIIRRIEAGGTPARSAIAHFYDTNSYRVKIVGQKFPYLEEEDLLFAYSTAVTQLVAKIEKRQYDQTAQLGTFLQSILQRRCIDLARKQTSEWKKRTLEEWKAEPFEEDQLETEAYAEEELPDKTVRRVAVMVNLEEENQADWKDHQPGAEAKMISQEFVEELKNRIGGKPWEVLSYKASGYGPQEIAEKFAYRNAHSATQSCSAYRRQMYQIVRQMRDEGW